MTFPPDPTQTFGRPGEVSHLETLPPPEQATLSRWEVLAGSQVAPGTEFGSAGPGYVLRKVIGVGGMGEVWEAVQTALGRVVAVKRIRHDRLQRIAENPDAQEQQRLLFRQEAMMAARLEHPNIVPVHDLGSGEDGSPLLAMKMVQGSPWDRLLAKDFDTLGEADYLARHLPILVQVIQAVCYAHARGIVHRDIKPAQVMIGDFGEVVLMDWGLAVFIGTGSSGVEDVGSRDLGAQHLPRPDTASSPSGTPAMMAPEQTDERATRIGAWTDVYLLGGTLYILLTGTFPHRAETSEVAFERAKRGEVQHPQERVPSRSLPPELCSLALKAMEFDPSSRFATAREFLETLQDYLSGASRRRESIEICDLAARRLSEARNDYQILSECSAMVARSLTLWSENQKATHLEEEVFAAHAQAALAHGDLMLARMQADRLPPGAIRIELLDKVSAAESRAVAQHRQRRMAVAGVVILLAVLATGSLWYSRQQKRNAEKLASLNSELKEKRELADRRAEEARTARGGAEELVNFMVGNLYDQLKDVHRLDLLEEANNKAFAHFQSVSPDSLDAEERLRLASGFGQVGMIYAEQGQVEQARASLESSIRVLESDKTRAATDLNWALELALARNKMAETCIVQGRLEEATGILERALSDLEGFARKHPENPALSLQIAEVLTAQSMCLRLAGKMEDAISAAAQAVAIVQPIYESNRADTGVLKSLANARTYHADAFFRLGRFEEAVLAGNEYVDLWRHAVELQPTSRSLRTSLAESLIAVTVYYNQLERFTDSEALLLEARSIADSLLKEEPTNIAFLAGYRDAVQQLSLVYSHTQEFDKAFETGAESTRIGKQLVDRDPTNVRWLQWLGHAQAREGYTYSLADELEDALASWQAARQTFEQATQMDPENTVAHAETAWASEQVALMLLMLHRAEEAVEPARMGAEKTWELHQKVPGHLSWAMVCHARAVTAGLALLNSGRSDEAIDYLHTAEERARTEFEAGLPNANEAREYAAVFIFLSGCASSSEGDMEAAESSFLKYVVSEVKGLPDVLNKVQPRGLAEFKEARPDFFQQKLAALIEGVPQE